MRHSATAVLKDEVKQEERIPTDEERLSRVDPAERVLLMSHCLRCCGSCPAKIGVRGIDCIDCNPDCQVNRLRKTALDLGYKGVCIAPGGSMALKFVRDMAPRGIVAVACQRELEEGIDSVRKLAGAGSAAIPPIVIVPLIKEGCVDTEVNVDAAIASISLGCGA